MGRKFFGSTNVLLLISDLPKIHRMEPSKDMSTQQDTFGDDVSKLVVLGPTASFTSLYPHQLQTHFLKHHDDWYAWIQSNCSEPIKYEELLLVTGVSLVTEWKITTISTIKIEEARKSDTVSLHDKSAEAEAADADASHPLPQTNRAAGWVERKIETYQRERWGPLHRFVQTFESDEQIAQRPPSPTSKITNQCVFLQAWRHARRPDSLQRSPTAAGVVPLHSESHENSDSGRPFDEARNSDVFVSDSCDDYPSVSPLCERNN